MDKIKAAQLVCTKYFSFDESYRHFISLQTNSQVMFDIMRISFAGNLPCNVDAFICELKQYYEEDLEISSDIIVMPN